MAAKRPRSARSPRPLVRPRLYERLVEQLNEFIDATGLAPGDRLLPERELATRLGVSRATVSQALVALEVQGIIEVRHGEGAILLDTRPDQQVLSALRAHQRRLPEVLEAREALEAKIAELAARRRTDEDLAAIDEALELMEQQVIAGDRGLEGDERFHRAVTAAAHSSLLADLMAALDGAIRESRLQSLSQPGRPLQSLRGHQEIAEAIRAYDTAEAVAAMHRHIDLVRDVALLRAEPDSDDSSASM
jgi:GntR family transcriptional repressor for pyruvate dehydrogenase complex